MRLLLVGTAHAYKTKDGRYYTPAIHGAAFLKRYLKVFDEVRFVSRTTSMESKDTDNYLLMNTHGAEIWEMHWYRGMKSLVKNLLTVIKSIRGAAIDCDCVILRMPQIEGYLCYLFSGCAKLPMALEVVNDPGEWKQIPAVLKWMNLFALRYLIDKSYGVSYVTREYLQSKYPKTKRSGKQPRDFFTDNTSDVEIPDDSISPPKQYRNKTNTFELIHVANPIQGELKGHRIVIDIVNSLKESGKDVRAVFIGDGPDVPMFREYARTLGVGDRVFFMGRLASREKVMERLRQSDLFLFPSSFPEGLPRCVVEAQAAGLPCLASPAGGIPELIEDKYLFNHANIQGFSDTILQLLDNPAELEAMSARNIEVAKEYVSSVLEKKRMEFYSKLRDIADR